MNSRILLALLFLSLCVIHIHKSQAATVHVGHAVAVLPLQYLGYGHEMWGYLGQYTHRYFDAAPRLVAATAGIAPTLLRLGGITADFVDYRMDLGKGYHTSRCASNVPPLPRHSPSQ